MSQYLAGLNMKDILKQIQSVPVGWINILKSSATMSLT